MRCVGEAARLARERGIGFVPGIGIDCHYRGTDLHLLGYGIDWRSADFARLEEEVAAKVMASFGAMVDNLLKLGFGSMPVRLLPPPTETADGRAVAGDALRRERPYAPLRPWRAAKRATCLIIFPPRCFAQGRPAFVPVEYMDYRDAVGWSATTGACPSWRIRG